MLRAYPDQLRPDVMKIELAQLNVSVAQLDVLRATGIQRCP